MLLNIGLNLVDTVFCSIWRFLGCQRSDVASYQGDCVKEKYALADEAFVTLATDDSYSLGALVLGHSLRIVQTSRSLVILVTAGVTADMSIVVERFSDASTCDWTAGSQLASVFDLVQEVDEIDSEDEANLAILTRPELGVTFTKIQCWKLTQFKKCVFLDADTLVLRNCDELFNREELSAVPDIGWPDCFNSGVFVFKPSDEMYKALVAFAKEKGSFDGGDQGLLNLFFQDWATKDISHHLSFLYNMNSNACYTYLPAFKKFGNEVKIVHFLGEMKPWMYKVSEGKIVKPRHSQYYCDHLQYWWDLFLSHVWPHQDIPSNDLDKVELKLPEEIKTSAFQVHSMAVNLNSRQEAWEKGQIDYMGVDCFENIRKKLDSKIYGLK